VDDLAPGAPTAFTGIYSSERASSTGTPTQSPTWPATGFYRGTTAGFVPGPSNLVAALGQTSYVDNAGSPYYYKLSAVDTHGNQKRVRKPSCRRAPPTPRRAARPPS